MIQGGFSSMIGSEAIGFSGTQFRLVVEALNNAARELAFGPKPVQQQGPVSPQLARHLLHWLDLRSHCFCAPLVQKLARPEVRLVRPEQLELFLQQVAPDRLQIVAQKFRQLRFLLAVRFSGRLSSSQRVLVNTGS